MRKPAKLGELLIKANKITEEELEKILEYQKESGKRLVRF